ncbi:hypothetical protein BB559_000734 [Furculomyces boomerangus]|uniref:Transmembrane protein n=1 Tax=Furculomyces boomerangus TaxID=61424 RepID=A0A2T9Z491_9FUNG|nr:hypothetical protein BB559_000734 [Furculomyces boomerangus]
MLSKLIIISIFSFLINFLNAKPLSDSYQSLLDATKCVLNSCIEQNIDSQQKCTKKCYEDNNASHVYDAMVKCYYECASKSSGEISTCTNGCQKTITDDIMSGKLNTKSKPEKSGSPSYKTFIAIRISLSGAALSMIVLVVL